MQEINFETFNDGIAFLHAIEENGEMKKRPEEKLRFGNRIVGESQYYDAMAAGVKISRRIRIPMYVGIDEDKTDTFCAVIGKDVYEIIRARHCQNKNPPCTDLTLKYIRGRK